MPLFGNSCLMAMQGLCMAAVACLPCATGCNRPTEDPATLALREKFLVSSLPDPLMSLTKVAASLSENADNSEPLQVTVVGRISAGDLEPWESGKASFVLSELPEDGHGEGHDADNCPFCKRRAAKAPTGIVKFLDEKDETIAVDARDLFSLSKDQHVAIRGTAIAGEFNSVVLIADQLCIIK